MRDPDQDEYAHLSTRPLSHFQHRVDKGGREVNPSPLDGLDFCEADTREIGKLTRGQPNRITVAAFARDAGYLTHYGAKDPTEIAERIKREGGPINLCDL